MARPRRLYFEEKTNKPFYIINKKKRYVKLPKAGVSMRQLQKVNIKNIIQQAPVKKVKRRKKRIQPMFQSKLVSTMKQENLPSPFGSLPAYLYQPKKPVVSIEEVVNAYIDTDKNLLKNAEVKPQKQKISIETQTDKVPEERRQTFERQASPSVTATASTFTGLSEPLRSPTLSSISEGFRSISLTDTSTVRRSTREKKPPSRFIPGKGRDVSGDGLYNDEVEKIAKKRLKYFVPCIASDETEDLMKYVKRGDKEFAFVINTDPSTSPGRHWTCVYIDNRDSYPSMEFFDPLAEGRPPDAVVTIMRKIAKKMNPEMMFKYKYNIIRRQSNYTNNCAHHCIKFLEDRYNGFDWSEASGYEKFMEHNKERFQHADGSVMGEKEVEKVMPKYNSYI